MSGIDLAILVKGMYLKCQISLLSGQGATADLLDVASKQGHYFQVLAKPVHPVELLGITGRCFSAAEQDLKPSGLTA